MASPRRFRAERTRSTRITTSKTGRRTPTQGDRATSRTDRDCPTESNAARDSSHAAADARAVTDRFPGNELLDLADFQVDRAHRRHAVEHVQPPLQLLDLSPHARDLAFEGQHFLQSARGLGEQIVQPRLFLLLVADAGVES